MRMKQWVAALLGAALFLCSSGCLASSHETFREEQPDRVAVRVLLQEDSAPTMEQTAQELARRAELLSSGELAVEVVPVPNLEAALDAGEGELYLAENDALVSRVPELSMMQLPYLFKNPIALESALNTDRSRRELEQLLQGQWPVQLLQTASGPITDMLALSGLELGNYERRYRVGEERPFFTEEADRSDLTSVGVPMEGQSPQEMLRQNLLDLAPVRLDELSETMTGPLGEWMVLCSAHQVEPVYLMADQESFGRLTGRQQAALQEASVRAAGYGQTLWTQQRQHILESWEQAGAVVQSVNAEKYFSILQEIYQYHPQWVQGGFSPTLARYIRIDAVTVSADEGINDHFKE